MIWSKFKALRTIFLLPKPVVVYLGQSAPSLSSSTSRPSGHLKFKLSGDFSFVFILIRSRYQDHSGWTFYEWESIYKFQSKADERLLQRGKIEYSDNSGLKSFQGCCAFGLRWRGPLALAQLGEAIYLWRLKRAIDWGKEQTAHSATKNGRVFFLKKLWFFRLFWR